MKKSVKAIANVVAVFMVVSVLMGMVGCIAPQQAANPLAGGRTDATGAWKDAVSDFERIDEIKLHAASL